MNKGENQTRQQEQLEQNTDKAEDVTVPAEEPDFMGRWVLRGKNFLAFFLRPLWKGGALFLAPLWKPFQKGADKITRRDWALFLIVILSIVLVVTAPVAMVKIRNTHREKEKLYCLFLGEKIYWENGKFEIDDQNRVKFSDAGGKQLNVSGWPFYYEGEDTLFWPFYGIWYPVENTTCARIERFSQIKYEYENGCSIQLQDGSQRQLSGFLYDNQDTYVFLENVTLTYNDQTRGLSPLSYVRVYGNNSMDLYYYGQEEGEVINFESDPEIRFSNGVKIDLKGDVMYYPNGIPRMLFVTLEYINPLGSE